VRGYRLAVPVALTLAVAGLAGASDYAPGEPLERFTGPKADFAFRCKGCHGFAGEGTPGHVPQLDGFVGLFTWVPEGREYLTRVPGVARAALNDERLAGVLNWMLETYGAGQVAPGFAPFTPEEVGAARRRPLPRRQQVRDGLVAELQRRGLLEAGEDGFGRSPESRE
jgi:hypothetical protein